MTARAVIESESLKQFLFRKIPRPIAIKDWGVQHGIC